MKFIGGQVMTTDFLLIQYLPARLILVGERKQKMFDVGPTELIIVLVIVILLFGPGRLAKLMGELGSGIRSFKDSLSSEEKTDSVSDGNISPK